MGSSWNKPTLNEWATIMTTTKHTNTHTSPDSIEHQRIENELRKSEEIFRLAARASQDVIWDWDLVTNEGWRSDTFQTRFGYTAGQLKAATESWYSGIHPLDKDRVVSSIRAAIDSDLQTWSDEYRFFLADKSMTYIFDRGYILRDDKGKPLRMLGVMMDISERKQTEKRMRKQAALLDQVPDAVCLKNLDHQILFWNKGAERLYGWSAKEAIGKSAHELLLQDNPFDPKIPHQSVVEKGEWRGELYHVTKEGRKLVVESRWTLLRNEQGEPESILVFNIDQTEKKQASLQELRAQRLQSIGALAGGIAHDLSNALTPIAMGVSFLRDEPISPDGVKMLDLMKNSIQHSAEMVKQILSFSRGVGGEQKEVAVQDLVAEMVKLIKETFPRSIKLNVAISESLPPVMGNPTQIYQVLLNLCVNARDAMPHGGCLNIATENICLNAESLPQGRGLNPGSYVLLKIEDTGSGIPTELLEKIFEPFFTTKARGQGTGLGLSTVMGIIKTHGGFLDVQSQTGKGTTFKVYLPASNCTSLPKEQNHIITEPK
ncbi:MAG: multi-sensor hybrid histidine kinase [Pedosphaera sp.]|nr:multi-sensor hybrid histidine kinase [Pedosphaera sp.]